MDMWLRLVGRVIFIVGIAWCAPGAAQNEQQPDEGAAPSSDLDVIDWNLAKQRMKMLSQMGYHPFLMPLIMENRDAIGLSNEQVRVFRDWRSK
ncbi:MAG: hypothetical protein WBM59_06975, partial [Sedimenticolaceae bacterium]